MPAGRRLRLGLPGAPNGGALYFFHSLLGIRRDGGPVAPRPLPGAMPGMPASSNSGYVSANCPVDFAFPGQVNNASLNLPLDKSDLRRTEMPQMDPETFGKTGINTNASTGRSERIPAPIQLLISLRVMFG